MTYQPQLVSRISSINGMACRPGNASMSLSQERTIRFTVAVSDLAFCRTSCKTTKVTWLLGRWLWPKGVLSHLYVSLWDGIRASNDLKHSQKLFSNGFYPSEFELQLVIPSDLCVSTPMRVVLQLTHVILHGIQLMGQTLYARCWPQAVGWWEPHQLEMYHLDSCFLKVLVKWCFSYPV